MPISLRSFRLVWLAACAVACVALVSLPGCSGCRRDPAAQQQKEEEEAEEKRRKEKEKPKPDFEVGKVRTQPFDDSPVKLNSVKLGHWATMTQEIRANNFDFQGEIRSATADRTNVIEVENTTYRQSAVRPAPLPKGQMKQFELMFYLPRPSANRQSENVWLKTELTARGGARSMLADESASQQLTRRLPAYCYFFVVLAADHDKYGYLGRLDSIYLRTEDLNDDNDIQFYSVVSPPLDQRLPLPSHPLTWTTIAYLLWDGANPKSLSPEQQRSLVDWLHWGGQLVISGPGSLDTLAGSFLDPYLPAKARSTTTVTQAQIDEINREWALHDRKKDRRLEINIVAAAPPLVVDWEPHADSRFVDQTGGLVCERRVGAGRIVATAFSLTDRQIVNWGAFDSFFNSALLRRPTRYFKSKDFEQTTEFITADGYKDFRPDARQTTTLRYFSRDVGTGLGDSLRHGGYAVDTVSGVAGWNDNSGVSQAARETLKTAAGIEVPKAGFVLRILGLYLVVLVPVNWAFFRTLGRVEWAWIAAPVIALLGAVAIIRLVQLDIGFARSLTEVATLEVQGNYPRGHLTRYSALYTSLSTSYRLEFDDESPLAQPFAARIPMVRGMYDRVKDVVFRADKGLQLQNYQVDSNTTGFVHVEQMFDLDGVFELSGDDERGWQVRNGSNLSLKEVGVLRGPTATMRSAWIGDLKAKSRSLLTFAADATVANSWKKAPLTAPLTAGQLSLGALLERARDSLTLAEGEFRLIGVIDEPLAGVTVRPRASQAVHRTLVVVHLRRPAWKPAKRDVNLKSDVEADRDEPEKPLAE